MRIRGKFTTYDNANSLYPKIAINEMGQYQIVMDEQGLILFDGEYVIEPLKEIIESNYIFYGLTNLGSYVVKVGLPNNIVMFLGIPVTYDGKFVTYSL